MQILWHILLNMWLISLCWFVKTVGRCTIRKMFADKSSKQKYGKDNERNPNHCRGIQHGQSEPNTKTSNTRYNRFCRQSVNELTNEPTGLEASHKDLMLESIYFNIVKEIDSRGKIFAKINIKLDNKLPAVFLWVKVDTRTQYNFLLLWIFRHMFPKKNDNRGFLLLHAIKSCSINIAQGVSSWCNG